MTTAAILEGEYLAHWQFFCDRIPVYPDRAVWGVDEDRNYRFAYKCPKCRETHTPSVFQVVCKMEELWELETALMHKSPRSAHPVSRTVGDSLYSPPRE